MSIKHKVWVEKYRPKTLDELLLSEKNKEFFEGLESIPNNLIFLGKSGGGKSTLAKILANKFAPNSYLYLNASDENSIDVVRNKISDFVSTASFDGNEKVVILDECDFFSGSAQGALRVVMEEYLSDVKFILTGNYKHKIMSAIQSRCQEFEFVVDLRSIAKRVTEILKAEQVKIPEEAKPGLIGIIKKYYPDIRKTINEVQKCCKNGEFKQPEIKEENISDKVYEKLKAKENVFEIRKFVIDNEFNFDNDYHMLMRNLFDKFVKDGNVGGTLHVTEHMYRSAFVLDQEVNFSALLFQLSKLP